VLYSIDVPPKAEERPVNQEKLQELKKQQVIINHKVLKKLLKIWELTIRRNIRRREKSGIEKILEFLGVGAGALLQ